MFEEKMLQKSGKTVRDGKRNTLNWFTEKSGKVVRDGKRNTLNWFTEKSGKAARDGKRNTLDWSGGTAKEGRTWKGRVTGIEKERGTWKKRIAGIVKKRRIWKSRRFLCIAAAICLLLCSILFCNAMIRGKAAGAHMVKYYTSIRISQGDSLWTIAISHMGEGYDDIYAYIEEVKELNQLTSDRIHAGQYLMLPYYSSE